VARLRESRRGLTSMGIGLILGAWLFFAAILLFQWWFSIHHPILTVLFLPFELLFDVIVFVLALMATVMGFLHSPGTPSGRQVRPAPRQGGGRPRGGA